MVQQSQVFGKEFRGLGTSLYAPLFIKTTNVNLVYQCSLCDPLWVSDESTLLFCVFVDKILNLLSSFARKEVEQ